MAVGTITTHKGKKSPMRRSYKWPSTRQRRRAMERQKRAEYRVIKKRRVVVQTQSVV